MRMIEKTAAAVVMKWEVFNINEGEVDLLDASIR